MTRSKQRKHDAAARNRYLRDLARVHCLKKELGLDRDLYEDILEEIIGRRSAKAASPRELFDVIAHLEAARKNLNRPAAAPARRAGDGAQFPTQPQLDYIAFLEDLAGWAEAPDRLLGFIRRQARGTTYMVESMPRALVSKVITGLEAVTGYKPPRRRTNKSS